MNNLRAVVHKSMAAVKSTNIPVCTVTVSYIAAGEFEDHKGTNYQSIITMGLGCGLLG